MQVSDRRLTGLVVKNIGSDLESAVAKSPFSGKAVSQ